jgi:hypothetical protein
MVRMKIRNSELFSSAAAMAAATYLRSPPRIVCDVAGFCGGRAGSGSGARGGGTGRADLRGRRLAGRRDQEGAPSVGRIWERGARGELRPPVAKGELRPPGSGREASARLAVTAAAAELPGAPCVRVLGDPNNVKYWAGGN